jgi:hypothetical protein
MTQNTIPCKECLSYAKCIANKLVKCDNLWNQLEECKTETIQGVLWETICNTLPNMMRIRWETNPYSNPSSRCEKHSYARNGGI